MHSPLACHQIQNSLKTDEPVKRLHFLAHRFRPRSLLGAMLPAVYAPASHFFMKLDFAAPDNFLPSLATARVAQVSRLHFCMKLVFAAPASGLPFFPTALLSQVSCAMAEPTANTDNSTAKNNRLMLHSSSDFLCA
jgi:hypothetical protein